MKNKFYAGIDVGGTKIAAGLVTSSGRILSRAKSPTPKDASPKKIARIICDLLEETLYNANVSKKDLAAIGVGIPGLIDTDKGRILRTPNMSLSGSNLQKLLKKKLKMKVALANDVNLGVLGEKWLGAGRSAKNIVGLFIGTGVGGGIIIDGELVTGSHGAAAELGHMIIQDNGPKCGCGNSGCLEAFAGRWAIERDIRRAIAAGKKTAITKLLDKKSSAIKSRTLYKALRMRDPLVTGIVKEASRRLGIACISIKHVFDPEMIVLGGGVIEACAEFILPIVKKTAKSDKFFSEIGACEIVVSSLKDDAIILGGAALAKTS